jgi:hypothetical protein
MPTNAYFCVFSSHWFSSNGGMFKVFHMKLEVTCIYVYIYIYIYIYIYLHTCVYIHIDMNLISNAYVCM